MKFTKTLLLTFLVIFQAAYLFAQTTDNEKQFSVIEKKIYRIFLYGNPGRVLKDSVSIYAINFRLTLEKKNDSQTTVSKIVVNDSLGYKLYPRYKELYDTNFIDLMGSDSHATLLIPILIYNATENKIRYKDENYMALINMQAAINAAYALYSTTAYSNLSDANENLMYRIKDTFTTAPVFEKIITFRPIIVNTSTVK